MISSPSPPDPYEQADAQAGANIDSAVANDLLNNRTEISPTGKVEYIDRGVKTIIDSQGNQRNIPVRDRVVSLSGDQQRILDLTEETSKKLLGTASDRAGFLQDYLKDSINTDDLTPWADVAEAPVLDTGRLQFGDLEKYGGPTRGVAYGYDGADTKMGRVAQPGTLVNHVPVNTDFGGISASGGGRVGAVSGDVEGVGEGIQRSVDLNTNGGSIGTIKRDFAAERLSGEIDNAGPIRTDVGYAGPGIRHNTSLERFSTPLEGAGEVRRSLGVDDFSEDRRRVEDAVLSRYNRHFDRMESELDAKLRAQGLVPGSEAYDKQFRQLREQENDAVFQAILAGGQEHSRLFGLERDSAFFENASQQQEFDQNIAEGRFGLDVNAQNNQTILAADRFFNEAVGQGFQQALEAAMFGNAAQGQLFGQNLQQTLLRMDATERKNEIEEMRARLNNDAERQFFEHTLANAGFGNQAELQMGNFVNAAQQQGFGQEAEQTAQRIAAGGVNNQAAQIENQFALGQANLQLQAQKAANDALLAQAGFHNDSVTQGLTNDLTAAGFNNQMTQAEIDNLQNLAEFYNASQNQDFTQGLLQTQQNNVATQQNSLNAAAERDAYNQALRDQYALYQSQVDRQNLLRQNELQEAAYLRAQPLNEISSLMSGSSLMMPQFSPPFQTGTQPVPIANYIQQAYESELANRNAAAQGLFGVLGKIASLPFSDRRLKTNIRRLGRLQNGVPVYVYNHRYDGSTGIGVMSDEVSHIPGAVVSLGGIDRVDYRKVLASG